jgi:hypothetical protein
MHWKEVRTREIEEKERVGKVKGEIKGKAEGKMQNGRHREKDTEVKI